MEENNMSDENIIDVDQNETDTCEEITDTDTISGEDKSENISTNEAAGTTEDIDADYSIDEEPGESSENTSCSEANEATTVSGATASQVAETGGSKRWSEYTSSAELDDADELMILDTSAKANKRTLLSKLSDYVLGKLADKVFEKLETQNKTILGALNELNSKGKIRTGKNEFKGDLDTIPTTTGELSLYWFSRSNITNGISGVETNTNYGTILTIPSTSNNYGVQFAFFNSSENSFYFRKKNGGTWNTWKKIS
jgi:hypothetical protein